MLDVDHSTLVLVDFQARLAPVIEGAAETVTQATRLAEAARLLKVPVIATAQNPERLGDNDPRLVALTDFTVSKTSFDATRAPELLECLPSSRPDILLAGWEAHVCVLQTAFGFVREGFKPVVVADAVSSRKADSKTIALQRLAAHGIEIVTTEMVLFEWLGSADHPAFREVLRLIK